MKPFIHRLHSSLGRSPGVYEHSRGRNVGSDAASWVIRLEQGLDLGGMLGMKTSVEREARRESSGEQPQTTASAAAGRAAVVSPSSGLSDGEGVVMRREGDVLAQAGKHSSS